MAGTCQLFGCLFFFCRDAFYGLLGSKKLVGFDRALRLPEVAALVDFFGKDCLAVDERYSFPLEHGKTVLGGGRQSYPIMEQDMPFAP